MNDKGAAKADEAEPSTLADDALYLSMRGWFKDDSAHSEAWRTQARKDFDFRAGKQWDPKTAKHMTDSEGKVPIVFNRVLPVIKAVAGIEINTRHETVFLPRQIEEGDIQANEDLTAASKWMADGCNAAHQESQAFQDAITCGMGWCLSGDTNVRLPKLRFATVREYSGQIVQVHLENGEKLTGTPNHPVLTNRGWQALGALHEGDYLISSAILQGIDGLPVQDFDQVETRLQDKVNAFGAGREVGRFVTAADDFYADGAGSKVHIVYADSPLGRQFRQAARRKHLAHLQFVWGGFLKASRALLAGLCAPLVAGRTPEGPLSVGVGHSPGLLLARFNDAAKCVASAAKAFAHCLAVEPRHLSDVVGGKLLGKVKPFQFLNGDAGFGSASGGAQFQSGPLDAPLNRRGAHAHNRRDFCDWKPVLKVEVNRLLGQGVAPAGLLIGIEKISLSHVEHFPVYDVGTTVGFFIAGNAITSNCEERMDYELDPDGKYVEDHIDPLEMYWDHAARKMNLSDSRRRWRARKMSLADARAMFPDVSDDDLNNTWAMGIEGGDVKPIEQRRLKADDNSKEDPSGEVTILQCQWWEREAYHRVANPFTGELENLTDKELKVLVGKAQEAEAMTGQLYPVESVRQTRRVYKQAFLGSKILKKGPCPRKDGFTLHCITGELDHTKGTWFGLISMMRDPQMMANKWLSQTTHIINTTAKGGILAEEDAFVDINEARATYAKPDAITFVKKGAIGQNKIMQKPGVGLAAPYVQLIQMAIEAIPQVTGINMELMGLRDAQQPGILEAQRKQAAMTILATIFDSLNGFRVEVGRTRLHFIQNYIEDGKIIRVLSNDGKYKGVRLLKDKMVGDYDVIVEEAPSSPNSKEQTWAALQSVLPALQEYIDAPLAVRLLNYVPGIPHQLVADFQASVTEKMNQPPNPDAEAAKRLAFEGQQAKVVKDRASAEKDLATAEKTRSETVLNQAGAFSQQMQAAREKARAIREIAGTAREVLSGADQFAVAPMSNGRSLPSVPQLPTGPEDGSGGEL